MATLHVMCGLPASGKSTLAKRIASECDGMVFSADAVRTERAYAVTVFEGLYRDTKQALAAGRNVVIDVCALHGFERARWLGHGRRAGARCELWIVNTPWRLCHERDREREAPSTIDWIRCAELVRMAMQGADKQWWDAVHYVDGGP